MRYSVGTFLSITRNSSTALTSLLLFSFFTFSTIRFCMFGFPTKPIIPAKQPPVIPLKSGNSKSMQLLALQPTVGKKNMGNFSKAFGGRISSISISLFLIFSKIILARHSFVNSSDVSMICLIWLFTSFSPILAMRYLYGPIL